MNGQFAQQVGLTMIGRAALQAQASGHEAREFGVDV
jgi:hypothetical protein